MFRPKRFKEQNSRGVAVLEVSMAMPFMLMTLFATVEFGRAFIIRQTLANAAGEAARVGSEASCPRPTESEVIAAATTMLEDAGLDASAASITVANAGGEPGTDVTVTIGYDVEFAVLSKLVSMFSAAGGVELSAHVEAENE
ncbi:MAG TPA: TadE/TadG family type IV pilus assembly protein [Candidatus Limnocylindrales bacterium]|nr:TadE/TadG family type IV pilus assembly protein [Candidatus Limnocylindrales bacterium]